MAFGVKRNSKSLLNKKSVNQTINIDGDGNEVETINIEVKNMTININSEALTDVLTPPIPSVTRTDGLAGSASDEISDRDPLEKHVDAEIDSYRDKIRELQPHIALEMLLSLQNRLENSVSNRIHFRITANIASCYLSMGDEKKGIPLLFEACALAPEEPMAVANLAFAYLLKGNWQKAIDIGREGLAKNPQNEVLAGFYIQALISDPSISRPLKTIPHELRESKNVRIANIFFLRQREEANKIWRAEAKELRAAFPDDPFIIQTSAEAVLDEILSENDQSSNTFISAEKLNEVRAAHEDLKQLWMKYSVLPPAAQLAHAALFTNLILSCDMLSELDEAKAILASACTEVLNEDGVSIRVAQLAYNLDDHELFSEALQRISSAGPRFQFKLYEALQKSDWAKIVEATENYETLALSYEREFIKTAREISLVMSFKGDVKPEQLLCIRSIIKEDIRGLIILFDALLQKGFERESTEVYTEAIRLANASGSYASRAMLSHRAAIKMDWAEVINLMTGYVDLSKDNKELRMITTAYVNIAPATKAAVTFFKELPKHISATLYYLEREAIFHYNRGALIDSERCFRGAIEISSKSELGYYLPLMSLLLRRQKQEKISELVTEMLSLNMSGTAEDKAAYSHLLMERGNPERAVEVAYASLVACPESAEVHSSFCTLILMNTRTGAGIRIIPNTSTVENGCWVSLARNDNEIRNLLISDVPQNEPNHLFQVIVSPNLNELARACIGKKVGDTFEQKDALGFGVTKWTVKDIRHRYMQVCQIILDEFNIRFPDSNLLGHMKSAKDEAQPILDYIRERSEYHRDISGYYTEQRFPISVVAALQGGSSIEYAQYLRSLGNKIQTNLGRLEERKTALKNIADQRMNGVVLDAYSAWTVANVEGYEVVRKVFGTPYIAQSCLDQITKLVVNAEDTKSDEFSISWHEGEFYRNHFSKGELKQRLEYLQGIYDLITDNCKVLPTVAPDEISEVSRELIQGFSRNLLDPIFCASTGKMLLSEDMYYRQLAEHEFSVKGVWLQTVIMYAVNNQMIDFDEYSRLTIAIAKHGHEHLAIEASVLIKSAIKDVSDDLSDFSFLAEYIGTRKADIHSHFSVVDDSLSAIWSSQLIDLFAKQKLSGILMNNLIRYRRNDWPIILAALYLNADIKFRRYIIRWIIGHFLPYKPFKEALQKSYARHFEI